MTTSTIPFGVRLHRSDYDRVMEIARDRQLDRSAVIRMAVQKFLAEENQKPQIG